MKRDFKENASLPKRGNSNLGTQFQTTTSDAFDRQGYKSYIYERETYAAEELSQ